MAFLIDSAIKRPAAAPLTMLAVMPSIPADAPCAAFNAAGAILDRPVLTLLIEASALLTSTSTTSRAYCCRPLFFRRMVRGSFLNLRWRELSDSRTRKVLLSPTHKLYTGREEQTHLRFFLKAFTEPHAPVPGELARL